MDCRFALMPRSFYISFFLSFRSNVTQFLYITLSVAPLRCAADDMSLLFSYVLLLFRFSKMHPRRYRSAFVSTAAQITMAAQ